MTQPDGLFPTGAVNLDSLAELAARPQSEWEAMIRGQSSNGFEMFLGALFGPLPADLREGIEFTRALVTAIIRQILNLPGQIWDSVEDALTALNSWAFGIPADVQARINESLGDLQDALEGNYAGSGPIFLAVQALAEAWLKATDPLNAANLFGRISLPQFGSGVPIMALTTAVPNELEPFSATSVPTADGWSFNAGQDAAQVVADGSTKTLYLQSGVIKVEAGQPLDTGVSVTYSGVSSGAGQSIRFVLETFTSDDGSGTATPVTVGSVSSPSGTITTPVLLGNSSWAIPAGVQSVRPALVQDLSAGTVFWKNTPTLKKKLAGQLAGGLPNALDNAGQAIRDAIANALGHSGTGHTSANILTYLQNIPKNVVDGLEDWWDLITGKTANITTGGLFDAGKLSNVTGTIAQSLVTGLPTSLSDLQTTLNQIGDIFDDTVVTPINDVVQAVKDWWNTWFGGGSTNAIPLSQKGAVNGVAPLDSNRLIPELYLPASAGGGGEPTEHILFTLAANQSVPSGTATALTGWQQVGSLQAPFDDGTNTRWTFPKAGWWDIQSQVVWGSSTVGKRQSAIVRGLSSGSAVTAINGESADNFPAWGARNKIRDIQEVADRAPLDATDTFSVEAYQNSGGALDAVAGYPNGTYVLATYLGQRESEFIPFSEENIARTNQPVPDGAAGCWVTLIGGGAGGGGGGRGAGAGGYGGGGGAKIFRTWIPVSALGSTYSTVRGAYGAPGAGRNTSGTGNAGSPGGDSTFSSGSVLLTAGGAPGQSGGTYSASGVSVTGANGTSGGNGATGTGSAAPNNTAGGAAGGGGGGGSNGGNGGATTTAPTGGSGSSGAGTGSDGANQSGGDPGPGGGGGAGSGGNGLQTQGGGGADPGGGGGGGGYGTGTAWSGNGRSGGWGYTLIEWE